MLEAKKYGDIVSASASLEKGQKVKKSDFYNRNFNKNENLNLENGESFEAHSKESESDSEKELGDEWKEINNSSLNTIREEKEIGSEDSVKKLSGGDDSSLEDSTVKQTWSGSFALGIQGSGSDFSSSEEGYEEEIDGKRERSGRGCQNSERNIITKDCNSDFHWVISEKRSETKPLFDTGQAGKSETQCLKYFEEGFSKNSGLNPFYSMDRDRKCREFSSSGSSVEPVQLRLPPHSPSSLDRKRFTKARLERDQKSKSSIISRSPQTARKVLARSFVEEINLMAFPESKKHDYSNPHDEWQQCFSEDNEKCYQHFRTGCSSHSCCLDCCTFHHQQVCKSSCRSYYGSCESLAEKGNKKNSFGSQRSLYEERKPKKTLWQDSQQRLFYGSNDYLACQLQYDREKSFSWRFLGKNGPELEERLLRLENDKESLQLQVSVLMEQVEAQNEKIMDLQQSLDDKKQQLTNTEDLLQREVLTRSSLETQKLELMSTISELKLQQAATERENYELKEEKKIFQNVKPSVMPRNTSPALLQSNSVSFSRFSPSDYQMSRKSANSSFKQSLYHTEPYTSQTSPVPDSPKYPTGSPSKNKVSGSPSSGSLGISPTHKDNIKNSSSSPQQNLRLSVDQYNSLPRHKILENQELSFFTDAPGRGVAFGKGLTSMITLKSDKSYSAPNLAETEKSGIETDRVQSETEESKSVETSQNQGNARKGIKKIFSKIKRSNSGNVNDLLGEGEFRRGGIRATAGPRLGGHFGQVYMPPNKPFAEWDTENLCNWLEDLGLENYVADLRRWVKSGSHFLSASSYEIEKELGIKNHLHKKKLLLALQEMGEKGSESDELLKPAGCLDIAWVMRWLDDVGLPQHKEVFLTARIDGRMLHMLTMDDLSSMHITSALHVASLKKGIKVLREHKMDPNCLTRRSAPDEPPLTAADVALWTNHRVMEWLRVVDLAEYAPNLRGSGVHGALMVYETKFTAELLASLLNIPPNKTLLRRHLNTHFKELLGREVIQAKREAETTLGYIPLTPSAKVKTIKKPQFTLKRKKNKNDIDFGDLVCPLDNGISGENCRTNTCMNANNGEGGMKGKRRVPDVCPLADDSPEIHHWSLT